MLYNLYYLNQVLFHKDCNQDDNLHIYNYYYMFYLGNFHKNNLIFNFISDINLTNSVKKYFLINCNI